MSYSLWSLEAKSSALYLSAAWLGLEGLGIACLIEAKGIRGLYPFVTRNGLIFVVAEGAEFCADSARKSHSSQSS